MKEQIEQYLKIRNDLIGYVFPNIEASDLLPLVLSDQNPLLASFDLVDTAVFNHLIFDTLSPGRTGIGGFLENRSIYRRSTLYTTEEVRSIHLGVDVWSPALTPIHAPLDGVIHSFKDNDGFGDYGPTIILEHKIENSTFYSLYGHLSRESLRNKRVGQPIQKDECFAALGNYPENGDWPPHLHFQVMTDLLGNAGDFPGVIAPSQANFYKTICIDPMLLLKFR
uniref:Peptidoglycan DD-metalloendopeptidase family protein n=1 Tax=Roseihalotalea indica TaxID=2867963 RepID=A0AA49JIT5_9BACT|nr:peptidoglycan DD-metalloendopeptidase family protein [Tunicatimonas sp. TK19036]